jgi:hypothetical protein
MKFIRFLASVELNKPPVKALLDLMGKNDLAGLKVILEAVLQGKVQTVVDLVAMLKEKSPGVYEVVITLMMSLQVNFEATVNLLGPKPASLMMTVIILWNLGATNLESGHFGAV